MNEENERRSDINWGSVISWLIFFLVLAGGPLLNMVRRIFGGAIALPAQLPSLIPLAILGLVVLSIAISAIRALGEVRVKRSQPSFPRPESIEMPDSTFSMPWGDTYIPQPRPDIPQRLSSTRNTPPLTAPRFDPIIPPLVLTLGLIGLVALIVGALVYAVQNGLI
jgi:hypothetical protein